jgi:sulfite reductase (NADPH) flavoprotein alpha-component
MTATLPKTAPFSADEIDTLNRLVAGTSPLQRSWLSGFLAGLDAAHGTSAPQAPAIRARDKLVILYGSETGNAEGLARKARRAAQKLGFDANMLDMADATPHALSNCKNLLVIASTWGEGDPPQRAAAFYNNLMNGTAPGLPGLRFAVLALGDTAYANFCATGRAIDERLVALGAARVVERIDLDLDYAKQAATWTDATLAAFVPSEPSEPPANVVRVDFKTGSHTEEREEPVFGADNPLAAELAAIINLNGTGSSSETYHLELATNAAGWCYAPGDAIGVAAANDAALVAELIDTVGLGPDPALAHRLITERDVTTLTRPVVAAYAKLTGRSDVAALAAPDRFPGYAAERQIIDLLAEHKERLTAEQLIGLLRPLPARLYSVASSLAAHPGETHLLVSAVRWRSHDRMRNGVASTWLASRQRGDTVTVFVKPNRHFRLPADASRPVVMIGAGTGVAPFRAFVEERAAAGATGKNWLFFGARNYTMDFLYQLEWQEHLASGALSRIDVAFSRDQPEKFYLQHRIAERTAELQDWIGAGAYIYVCGDEKGMARSVEAALATALTDPGLDALRKAGRYQRDVY